MVQSWMARREYDQLYTKLLELPSSISHPRASLRRMPGVVGKALWIDFKKRDPAEYDELKSWFVKHDGFTEFKSPSQSASKVVGDWEAEHGTESLIMSRDSESGWVHITLGQRMSPDQAQKDIASFPWNQVSKGR